MNNSSCTGLGCLYEVDIARKLTEPRSSTMLLKLVFSFIGGDQSLPHAWIFAFIGCSCLGCNCIYLYVAPCHSESEECKLCHVACSKFGKATIWNALSTNR